MYGIKMLYKHVHNQWKIGRESIGKLGFHKGQRGVFMIGFTHQGQFLGLAPKDLQQFRTCPKGHDNLVICIIWGGSFFKL
jgi:hypothetical protein